MTLKRLGADDLEASASGNMEEEERGCCGVDAEGSLLPSFLLLKKKTAHIFHFAVQR